MSKRTIRIPVEGGDGTGGRSVAVKRKLNTLGKNADFTFWISVLVRSANCLYNSLISKFTCHCIILVMAPLRIGPLRSARGVRIVSTQRTMEVHETSHCLLIHLLAALYCAGYGSAGPDTLQRPLLRAHDMCRVGFWSVQYAYIGTSCCWVIILYIHCCI